MGTDERDPLLPLLVLSGRSQFRPAWRVVHGVGARIARVRHDPGIQLAGRLGRRIALEPFVFSGESPMKSKLSLLLAAAALALVVSPARAGAQSLAGLWDATITMNNGSLEIPFRFELAGSGPTI